MSKKETFKQAGYKYVDHHGQYELVLLNEHTGEYEVWTCNKNHASYGLIYKNTHLEFCYSIGNLYLQR
jgi:hypothetical protein